MLDWRGSSGSLWGRGSKGEPDILTSTRDEGRPPEYYKSQNGKSRRKGLRKRFLSLTEGLATLINGNEKKEKERSVSRGNSKEKKFESSDINSGYCSDYEPRTECRRTNSIGSVSSFRPSLPVKNPTSANNSSNNNKVEKEWKSPLLERRCTDSIIKPRPGKAPPSPPPRRYSLWALPGSEEYIEPLKAPLSAHLNSYITSPPQIKPPPPPPPVRYCNQFTSSISPPGSPRIPPGSPFSRFNHCRSSSPSPAPVSPKRPESPVFKDFDSILYRSYTPPSSPLVVSAFDKSRNTPPRFSRANSEASDQRTDWYRRKALSRRSPFTRKSQLKTEKIGYQCYFNK